MATPSSIKAPEAYTRDELKRIFANNAMTDAKEELALALGDHYGPCFMRELMTEIQSEQGHLVLKAHEEYRRNFLAAKAQRAAETAAEAPRHQPKALPAPRRPMPLRGLVTRVALAVTNLI